MTPRIGDLGDRYVRKPLLSREGANVTLVGHEAGAGMYHVEGPYGEEGYIRQALHLLPRFGNDWTVIGSWIVAGQPAGIGIREDDTPITRDTSASCRITYSILEFEEKPRDTGRKR